VNGAIRSEPARGVVDRHADVDHERVDGAVGIARGAAADEVARRGATVVTWRGSLSNQPVRLAAKVPRPVDMLVRKRNFTCIVEAPVTSTSL